MSTYRDLALPRALSAASGAGAPIGSRRAHWLR